MVMLNKTMLTLSRRRKASRGLQCLMLCTSSYPPWPPPEDVCSLINFVIHSLWHSLLIYLIKYFTKKTFCLHLWLMGLWYSPPTVHSLSTSLITTELQTAAVQASFHTHHICSCSDNQSYCKQRPCVTCFPHNRWRLSRTTGSGSN